MINYFTNLPDDETIQDQAAKLHQSFHFLDENPNSDAESTSAGQFKSLFLYKLIASTHLSDITSFVEIRGWDTKQLASGKNGGGVVAIASVAVMYKILALI